MFMCGDEVGSPEGITRHPAGKATITPRPRPAQRKIRSADTPARHFLAPAHRSLAPTHRSLAPARHSLAPARRSLAPARRSLAPARHSLAPARRSLVPARHSHVPARHSHVPARRSPGLARQFGNAEKNRKSKIQNPKSKIPMSTRSHELFQAAKLRIPGGVNSPVRAFRSVGGEPFFVESASGCRVRDVDGRELIDYVGTWGPAILGHTPQVVIEAVREAAGRGLSFGIPNPLEVEMAETICRLVPSIEKVRMVNSGTEATMSCVRLARGFTGRDRIVKFEGCYHGMSIPCS